MRTFHTGGIASAEDITQGLPRVEELFESRRPKSMAIMSEICIDILHLQTACQSTADQVGGAGVGHADLAAHLTDDDLDMLIVDLNALQT